MGRFRDATSDDEGDSDIDMSPLIDCVFILLIFFIVTTVFVEETGIDVDKPQAASSSDLESNSILFAINANGDVVHAKQIIGVNGVQPVVKRLVQAEPDIPVIIQADRAAQTGVLVRVIDEAKLAGATKVNLATLIGGS